jgi:ribose-phosphate pyrophosphokinase
MISLDGRTVIFGSYPNGETKIDWMPDLVNVVAPIVKMNYENDQDLINLMILKHWMDEIGYTKIRLRLAHMPYARMDRTGGTTAFTLKYVCGFINALTFDSIEVADPHSDVCIALLDRAYEVSVIEPLVKRAVADAGDDTHGGFRFFVFPDAGAQKKYERLLGNSQFSKHYFFGIKHRNFTNGKIEKLDVHCSVQIDHDYGGVAFIVDDLCSRGGTFVGTAKALKHDWGFAKVNLIVAHCEPVAYTNADLYDVVDHVYTTDSMPWPSPRSPGFTRYDQDELLKEVR